MDSSLNKTFEVSPVDAGRRLDQILAESFPEFSRSRLQAWVKSGQVTVNGDSCKSKDKMRGGEQVAVQMEPPEEDPQFAPEDIPLNVVYEDDHILVINKPPGLVVHPGAGNWSGTLLNGLLHYAPQLAGIPRAGIVHRLDKDTSGLMVVAKTLQAHKNLVDALAERDVSREYLALVQGEMVAGGTVESPIGRHSKDRKRMAVTVGGKEAITHYRVNQRFHGYTLLDVKLETGRTHQIRVHLSSIHYPIVGDQVYGTRLRLPVSPSPELEAFLRGFKRQALHARKLGLYHPDSDEFLSWEAPVPEDYQRLLDLLDEHRQ
ncbi:MAG: 23S rRNA pseudouridine(1911/1915/1917) synthase RluD [bacterium]